MSALSRNVAGPLCFALAFLAGAFAGCLTDSPSAGDDGPLDPLLDQLSQPLFDILDGQSVWIESTADDTLLHAALFLPDVSKNAEWKAPTILVMSPYNGDDAREDPNDPASRPIYFRYQWLLEHFVSRGYAVAFEDVRGTGDSGGCLEQTAQLQWQDGYDSVEWFASQPWSNGKVGMFGKSYDAETQQSTAVTAPPHLATIVPVSSVSGQYEYSFYDGVPFTLQSFLSNVGYMESDGLQVPTSEQGRMQYPSRVGCHPGMLAQGLDMSGDWNAFWEDREIRHHADKVKASVLYVHGLQDWNVKPVAIRDWFNQIPSEKRALFGQWGHDYPEQNRWEGQTNWSRQDWRTIVHKWYDHYLLGLENGILDDLPPVQVQDSSGAWRVEETFPPVDATPLEFRFAGTASLDALGREGLDAPLQIRENDEAFLRTNTGLNVPTGPSDPFQESVTLVSGVFDGDVHFSGWPTLNLTIALVDGLFPYPSPDKIDAHFAANLLLEDENATKTWINAGYLSARHRNGVDQPEDVSKDAAIDYQIRFFPADTVIPAGSRLKLVLSMSDSWTQPQGCFCGAIISDGALNLPILTRDWEASRLDVPLGDPIDHK